MTEKSFDEVHKEFLVTFNGLAPYKHRYDVFRDFVTMSAIMLRNAIVKNQELENEYLGIIKGYQKQDQPKFAKLFALLVELLEFEPRDVLGNLFEDLELTSKEKGQFFTPQPISEFMSQIVGADDIALGDKPFITLGEPACGAGGMVLAFVQRMIRSGHNPAERLWVQAIDIDRMTALMCYVQLSLWNVPAEVIVGNTLSWEIREVWHTPVHFLGNWNAKLKAREQSRASEQTGETGQQAEVPRSLEAASEAPVSDPKKPMQFDFGF